MRIVKTMKAPDMFQPEVMQIFDIKTGARISYGFIPISEDQEPEPEIKDIKQLTLFDC